ncbi:MAG TPA: hypothetical protein VKH45_00620 [Candidatus Acidoferrum sp.]|nr:hypothetical protein [Candidatus Acidoferrum sp.]
MPLPLEIPVRYTEEDAGYVSVRPVIKQNFRLNELVDMVVRVTGKNASRVQQIFQSGTVIYNGYRYWWESLRADLTEIQNLLISFPEDDPSISLDRSKAIAVLFETGGGTQLHVIEISREEASEKRLFAVTTPWKIIVEQSAAFPARYEKYSHARKADLHRVSLPFASAQHLLASMLQSAPRARRNRWSTLRPPAALLFLSPR